MAIQANKINENQVVKENNVVNENKVVKEVGTKEAETKITPTKTTGSTRKTSRRKKQPKNFSEAYQILQVNAELLKNQDEPDIDNLMMTVEESIVAYKVCQQRLDAVQQALDETFANG